MSGASSFPARVGAVVVACAVLSSAKAAQELHAALLRPDDPSWAQTAPDTFRVCFVTTRGDFVLEVFRRWAPRGVDRFWNLARHGYYDDARFHRVVPGFIVQWGIAGDPRVSAVWLHRTILDDSLAVASNVRGTIAFAFTDKDTRATQVYINLVDNTRLDGQGFRPFGRVVEGMDVVDSLYGGYGESSGGGMRAAKQDSLVAGGNAYLDRVFPRLDHLIRAVVLTR
jgi:homoserine O-acetyltransferase